ncbi:carbohydrate-binding module family 21 protein [Cylindrobasidium torrendii FP15055 ss-10]|uniref:Carbohydrate-binding module family 21 protein n=1 Tax=Cylindrobasidium torrendii FP15055 ss-10 TaxID=1314674 RepID=A0A0D7BE54_9AGAR|nr:carbohydrate-binding module family 21 protein [Cylindrobasidium torrendii FP15055 ss-10]
MDRAFRRNSNLAGGPLPLIPRRTASAPQVTRSYSLPDVPPPRRPAFSSSSGSGTESGSSSSVSSGPIFLRPKGSQTRTQSSISSSAPRTPPTDDELDTPRPFPSTTVSAAIELPPSHRVSISTFPLIRKKSGQVVRSSLKGSRPASLDMFTAPTAGPSKSEPNTPSLSKAVKFDSQLEHVKLFLAEQKPLAVSHNGSPTDTSGTDSDFPDFIFGDDKPAAWPLAMNVINMPASIRSADVVLESLQLAQDGQGIVGRVRVRNLAFDKLLVARFTFDGWQTTSEVIARYAESPSADIDVFSFTIKLNDMLARIEEKTLVLALKYRVLGKELWDNNGSRNYIAKFSRSKPPLGRKNASRSASSGSDADMVDLTKRLKEVASSETRPVTEPAIPNLKSDTSLASRYDFKTAFKPHLPAGQASSHTRTHTYPSASPPMLSPPSSIPWPTKSSSVLPPVPPSPARPLGSPRDADWETFRPAVYVPMDVEDRPFVVQPRNHQRGYFDIGIMPTPTVRRTPPTSPFLDLAAPAPRAYSFPPVEMPLFGMGLGMGLSASDSDSYSSDSTPSMVSPSTSVSSDTDSPVRSPGELDLRQLHPGVSEKQNYSQFLDRFCFFTGMHGALPMDESSRSSSMSSVDDLLSTSPRMPSFVQPFTRHKAPSSSGATTPTPQELRTQ